jgi:hypothetical protein
MKDQFKTDTINFCILIGMIVVSYFLVTNILLNA